VAAHSGNNKRLSPGGADRFSQNLNRQGQVGYSPAAHGDGDGTPFFQGREQFFFGELPPYFRLDINRRRVGKYLPHLRHARNFYIFQKVFYNLPVSLSSHMYHAGFFSSLLIL
jgi:hypothetical protein